MSSFSSMGERGSQGDLLQYQGRAHKFLNRPGTVPHSNYDSFSSDYDIVKYLCGNRVLSHYTNTVMYAAHSTAHQRTGMQKVAGHRAFVLHKGCD